MLLTLCRYLALVYAVALAVAEAVINSMQPRWQYAPLWIIDYVIAALLLAGFVATLRGRNLAVLMSAYALSAGVMWMAFFLNLDPEMPLAMRTTGPLLFLIGLALAAALAGSIGSTIVWLRGERTRVEI